MFWGDGNVFEYGDTHLAYTCGKHKLYLKKVEFLKRITQSSQRNKHF